MLRRPARAQRAAARCGAEVEPWSHAAQRLRWSWRRPISASARAQRRRRTWSAPSAATTSVSTVLEYTDNTVCSCRERGLRRLRIEVLSGLEPVRKRPACTRHVAANHLAQEVIDNSVDEAIAGYAKASEVFSTRTLAVGAGRRRGMRWTCIPSRACGRRGGSSPSCMRAASLRPELPFYAACTASACRW